MLSGYGSIAWPLRWNGLVPDLCRRTYPWFLSIYLGTAPYYYVAGVPEEFAWAANTPGVPDGIISGIKILLFLLAVGTTSVAALASGTFRTPGGLLGPLGFIVLALLSIPGVWQGNIYWSANYAVDLAHAAALCWLFFWIVRSGEDLRRILIPTLAILYGLLAIQVVSTLAASDWRWSRLCGFGGGDPFGLLVGTSKTNTASNVASVAGLWLPAGALLVARLRAWSPWFVGAAFLLTILVLAAQFITTTRMMIAVIAGLSAALLLPREIRPWAAGMVLGFALVAATAVVSFAVLDDRSCFHHLDLDQQAQLFAQLFMDDTSPSPEEPPPEEPPPPAALPSSETEGVDLGTVQQWEEATSHRLHHYLRAFEDIRESPLLGHGFGVAEAKIGDLEIHNLWLKFAAYTGVLWPAWFALMVGCLLYRCGQLLRRNLGGFDALLVPACAAILAGALLWSMIAESVFIGPTHINAVIWVSAGVVLGLHGRLSAASEGGTA